MCGTIGGGVLGNPALLAMLPFQSPRLTGEAAKAFGAFQRDLIDLPDPPLAETIPEFHHTRKRFDRFVKTVEADSCERVKDAEAEIAFIRDRLALAEWFEDLQTNGK